MALEDIIKFDKYFWVARVFPTLIASAPFLIFHYIYLNNLFLNKLKLLSSFSIVSNSVITIAIIYISSIFVRWIGKDIIENFYFIKNNKFPTTQFLMGNKDMSEQQLRNLKIKIKKDFKINLLERCSKKEKRLRIKDSIYQIISKIGYRNKILNQYNIEYGFFRNLTGGGIIFFLTSLLLFCFSYAYGDLTIGIISLIISVISLVYLIFSWYTLDIYGTKYAKKLFSEYLK